MSRREKGSIVGILALVILGAAIVGGRIRGKEDPSREFYLANRDALNEAVTGILESGTADGVVLEGVWGISYWKGEHPIIELTLSASGLVPSTAYRGIYYSVDGTPAVFQNADVTLKETETGWVWQAEGDNRGKTERIEGNWFLFEASF